MRGLICLLILSIDFFIPNKIFGQTNLVPNPSFEDTISCNGSSYLIENYIKNWYGGRGYFRNCMESSLSVPANIFGHQNPRTGNAYCGIFTRGHGVTPLRNYIQTKLKQSLVNGKKYKVSYYVSLGDTLRSYTNIIGAYFSADSFFVSTSGWLVEHIPQIQNNILNNLGSKSDWSLVCDTFVAVGNEKYITIGNFYTDNLCPLTHLDSICVQQPSSWGCSAYYYIDDVSVELIDESGLSPTYLPKGGAFKVVPNPSNGSFVIQCIENNLVTCSIQNLSGQEVYIKTKQAQNLQVKIDDATLAKGIYILKVADKNGVQCLKLVVE
jgi:hypothetical protein